MDDESKKRVLGNIVSSSNVLFENFDEVYRILKPNGV